MLPLLALQWRSRLAFLGAGYALVLMLAVTWQSSTGLVRTILKVPLTWIFPVYQLLTLAALWAWDREVRWMKDNGWGWGLVLVIGICGPWALALISLRAGLCSVMPIPAIRPTTTCRARSR